jgi:hypothetical protein
MNRREKILALVVGALVVSFGGFFGARALIVRPLKDIDKRTAVLRDKIEKINAERRQFFAAEDKMKAYTRRAFADTIDEAAAKSGEMLTRQILQSGLDESDFTRLPVGPRKLRGANEIGWNVQGEGPLMKLVNLLFLLQESPYLHRVENVVVSPGENVGTVRVRFRYLTLVMTPAPEVKRTELAAKYTLESAERHILDSIITRDILRPYIKRPPAPPVQPGSTAPGTTPPAPAGTPGTFRIVSLSEWQGQPEVHVLDSASQKTARYKPGDQLAGGTIVMVDYRPLPMPGNSLLQSLSRVIVKVGEEFWAIERGKTLADKRKLAATELPAELAKLSSGK